MNLENNERKNVIFGALKPPRSLSRFAKFTAIGGIVFGLSNVMLYVLVSLLQVNMTAAYIIQAIVCVVLNVFLNTVFTWGDITISLRRNLVGNALVHVSGIVGNLACYSTLLITGMHYLAANLCALVVFTALKYVVLYTRVYVVQSNTAEQVTVTPRRWTQLPSVCVGIPVKSSEKTIRACVESLLAQTYTGEMTVVIVGDVGDSTWIAIDDYIRDGRVVAIEADISSERRDANAKRTLILESAPDVHIYALTDSDMILPDTWVEHGVEVISEGWECAGGPMESVSEDGFWASYIDDNPILPKTPRMKIDYVVTERNIGKSNAVPPVTATTFFTKDMVRVTGGFNPNMTAAYEDFEFYDRIAAAGHPVLCTPRLRGTHFHRESFKALTKDYFMTGIGCADFVIDNATSRFARQRKRQMIMLLTTIIGMIMIISGLLAVHMYAWLGVMAMFAAILYVATALLCVKHVRSVQALLFPVVTGYFTLLAGYGYVYRMWQIARSLRQTTQIHSVAQLVPRKEYNLDNATA